jgi:signal peptidase I
MNKRKQQAIVRQQVDRLGRPPVEMIDREIARTDYEEAYLRLSKQVFWGLVIFAAVIILITNLWITVLQVDGSSMSPLLRLDEIILVRRTRAIDRGDIIAFTHNNKVYIKRVIGMGGETVSIDESGIVSIDDEVLRESYIAHKTRGASDIEYPFRVRSGVYFVLGDNRKQTMDSRLEVFGTVTEEQVIGKVFFRLWPLFELGSIASD